MSSIIQVNANPTKPTSVDHGTRNRSKNDIDQTFENSFQKTRKKRPNSLLADSKAFENGQSVSNSTSQDSLHFNRNNNTLSFSSPVTENPTESVFTMYQNSKKHENSKPEHSKTSVSIHSNCALSVNDVEFIDETSQHTSRNDSRNSQYSSSTSINRNNSNNHIKSHYSPELTPTTKLFPILDILVQNSSPEKLLKVNDKASRKALQDKLSS